MRHAILYSSIGKANDTWRMHATMANFFTLGIHVRISDSCLGLGVFAERDYVAGDIAYKEEAPLVRICDRDAIDMAMCAEVLGERSLPRYAAIGTLLEREFGARFDSSPSKGWEALADFCEGSVEHFSNEIVGEIKQAVEEVSDASEEVVHGKAIRSSREDVRGLHAARRHGLFAFQSNAWRGDGFMALYTFTCRVNHSCCPNSRVNVLASGGTEVMVLQPVRAGEELLASYCATSVLKLPVESRRRHLADNWGFLCACERCARDLRLQLLASDTVAESVCGNG